MLDYFHLGGLHRCRATLQIIMSETQNTNRSDTMTKLTDLDISLIESCLTDRMVKIEKQIEDHKGRTDSRDSLRRRLSLTRDLRSKVGSL